MLLKLAAFFTQQHLSCFRSFFFFLHNQKWEMRSLRSHKIKQRRSLCQQNKWMNLFRLIILLFICMCHSGGKIQIWTRAFSAVTLTGSAGWVWCCLHFPEKVKCTFFWCVCQTQIYPVIKQKAPYHLGKAETETEWKEHLVPEWPGSQGASSLQPLKCTRLTQARASSLSSLTSSSPLCSDRGLGAGAAKTLGLSLLFGTSDWKKKRKKKTKKPNRCVFPLNFSSHFFMALLSWFSTTKTRAKPKHHE